MRSQLQHLFLPSLSCDGQYFWSQNGWERYSINPWGFGGICKHKGQYRCIPIETCWHISKITGRWAVILSNILCMLTLNTLLHNSETTSVTIEVLWRQESCLQNHGRSRISDGTPPCNSHDDKARFLVQKTVHPKAVCELHRNPICWDSQFNRTSCTRNSFSSCLKIPQADLICADYSPGGIL